VRNVLRGRLTDQLTMHAAALRALAIRERDLRNALTQGVSGQLRSIATALASLQNSLAELDRRVVALERNRQT
jgi:hypothetical protein